MKISNSARLFLLVCLLLTSCSSKKHVASKPTHNSGTPSASKINQIRTKYALALNVDKSKISNDKLFVFIDDWYGVPYRYGGGDKSGIDCSGFTNKLYQTVYSKSIPHSTKEIYTEISKVDTDHLKEGDLVFFKIENKDVSHVGVYLTNNKFVHATTKKGVMINDLNEPYYKKYYYKGGRIK